MVDWVEMSVGMKLNGESGCRTMKRRKVVLSVASILTENYGYLQFQRAYVPFVWQQQRCKYISDRDH